MTISDIRVMIVEDEDSVLATIRMMLAEIGINQVFEARDGDTAKELLDLDAEIIDVIICDWNMPNFTGIELLEHLRNKNIAMPFLMVTGRNDASSVIEAKEKGVTAYIRKPFSMAELEAKLNIIYERDIAA